MVGFGISGVEASGSTSAVLVYNGTGVREMGQEHVMPLLRQQYKVHFVQTSDR